MLTRDPGKDALESDQMLAVSVYFSLIKDKSSVYVLLLCEGREAGLTNWTTVPVLLFLLSLFLLFLFFLPPFSFSLSPPSSSVSSF